VADLLFFIFAAVAVGGALGVVIGRSPVASLLFMVACLASIAGIFVLLEAHFLAAVQIIVYAGAIMVLFLFVIMLLNLGHDYRRDVRGGLAMLVGFGVTGAMGGLLARQLTDGTRALSTNLGPGDAIDAALLEYGAVGVIARPLFTEYLVPFELTGILLLVAIVGAIVLSKKAS
jgi:NADH-quinone oxidoreductase subunit J